MNSEHVHVRYRMSLLYNYFNLAIQSHDTQRFLMHNILNKIYSDKQYQE